LCRDDKSKRITACTINSINPLPPPSYHLVLSNRGIISIPCFHPRSSRPCYDPMISSYVIITFISPFYHQMLLYHYMTSSYVITPYFHPTLSTQVVPAYIFIILANLRHSSFVKRNLKKMCPFSSPF
jgi:hypothetical protein